MCQCKCGDISARGDLGVGREARRKVAEAVLEIHSGQGVSGVAQKYGFKEEALNDLVAAFHQQGFFALRESEVRRIVG